MHIIKKASPWVSIVLFLFASIATIIKAIEPDMEIFNRIYAPIPFYQLTPATTNIISAIIFFLLSTTGAVVLGISGKRYGFPIIMGIYILLSLLFTFFQEYLYTAEVSTYILDEQYAANASAMDFYCFYLNLARMIYCLPMAIMALYMIGASFLKLKGWIIPVLTISFTILMLGMALICCFPYDTFYGMNNISIIRTFGISGLDFSFEDLMHYRIMNNEFIGAVLGSWITFFLQFSGLLLYLPVALHRPKSPEMGS